MATDSGGDDTCHETTTRGGARLEPVVLDVELCTVR